MPRPCQWSHEPQAAQEVLELLQLICLFEIIEEKKDKSTLTYPETVPWPSLMEVFVGHQHRKPIPPPWPRPLTISMEIVGLQNETTNPQTCQALHHLRLPRSVASIRNIWDQRG